jgi:hypothetical protein
MEKTTLSPVVVDEPKGADRNIHVHSLTTLASGWLIDDAKTTADPPYSQTQQARIRDKVRVFCVQDRGGMVGKSPVGGKFGGWYGGALQFLKMLVTT